MGDFFPINPEESIERTDQEDWIFVILKNQLKGLAKETEFLPRTVITILWEEWLKKE